MRPNILMIHTDQQRFDTLRANGNRDIYTPNLDRLSQMGTNFSCCICQNPVCMPSRISLMTGKYGSQLGISRMACTVPEETLTIQKILKRYGYETAMFGKLHYLPHANRDHRKLHPAYDFDRMVISDEPGCYEDDYRAWVRSKKPQALLNHPDTISLRLPPATKVYQQVMHIEDGISHPEDLDMTVPVSARPFRDDDNLTHSAFVAEKTVEFLNEGHEKPFFCFTGFFSPHTPFIAPKKYFDLYPLEKMELPHFSEEYLEKQKVTPGFSDDDLRRTRQGYYAMISEVDHYVGEILNTLEKNGMLDNTIIVFTSDHGEFLGEYLRYGKGCPAPDVVSRVPLIFCVPEKLKGVKGKNLSQVVEGVDVVPTLLKLLAIPLDGDLHGNVLPVAEHLTDGEDAGDGCGLTEYGFQFKTIRSEKFRYTVFEDGSEAFFDLEKDPYEYHNEIENPLYLKEIRRHQKLLFARILKNECQRPLDFVY